MLGKCTPLTPILLAALLVLPGQQAFAQSTDQPSYESSLDRQETHQYTVLHVNPEAGDDQGGSGEQHRPFRTITHAIQVAQSNTVIVLSPGRYTADTGESFPLRLKPGITIQGSPDAENSAIIVGGGRFDSPTLSQQNVAIVAADRSGMAHVVVSNQNPQGQGVWVESGSPIIRETAFVANGHTGVYVAGGDPVIEASYFFQNQVAGLVIYGSSRAVVLGNHFEATGTAITVASEAIPEIAHNRILRNEEGIVLLGNARPIFVSNEISQNRRNGVVEVATAAPVGLPAAAPQVVTSAAPAPASIEPIVSEEKVPAERIGPVERTVSLGTEDTIVETPAAGSPTAEILAFEIPAASAGFAASARPAAAISPAAQESPLPAPSPATAETDTPAETLETALPETAFPEAAPPEADPPEADPIEGTVDIQNEVVEDIGEVSEEPLETVTEVISDETRRETRELPSAEADLASPIETASVDSESLLAEHELAEHGPIENGLAEDELAENELAENELAENEPTENELAESEIDSQEDTLSIADLRNRLTRPAAALLNPEPIERSASSAPPSIEISVIGPENAPENAPEIGEPETDLARLARPEPQAEAVNTAETSGSTRPLPSISVSANRSQPPPIEEDLPSLPLNTDGRLLVPGAHIPIGSGGDANTAALLPPVGATSNSPPPPPLSRAAALGLRYRVYVEGQDQLTQSRLRAVVPDAFRAQFEGQPVMQAGAYADEAEAEERLELLLDNDFEAWIEHTP
ncbi:MAG: DUF1565 domain-containing protein [Cyanobacteria bacterium P01_A01_bin.114]